ncbi:MAG TPA: HlyD family efflux transporter periplasmic adaptor subunit [Terriglobales bacterium]|jgi:putative peptide zinc metalloprotease protein|nr:HlyD family efflux transporter periplasmic adaptor subunit [Terriglobales bacterium]
MNLSEVLNVALPDLPARRSKSYPRIHPKLIMREHLEGGTLTLVAAISGGTYLYRFNPEQWAVVQLFDGERSYRQVAETYQEQSNTAFDESQVREFADSLEELDFWYKTPLEKNLTASQKLAETRQKQVKKKSIDLSSIVVASWDPDAHITRLHKLIKFVYTPWFIFLTLVLFILMTFIFIGGWSEIWRDTVEYYTFTDKSAMDLVEFWLLFCGLGFFHESAHALTCKHFGGEVHRTGFLLVYLSPAFFADITEVYVYGGKWQRIAAIFAGIWTELMFCSVASIIWWGTPAGSPVHDFAYKVMLITGVAVVLMNLNPLIKLDGYYLFGELIGIPTIKESSTEYLSSWVKHNLFRLPVEVPYLRRQRRWLFVSYAIISGAYSYVVLFAIVRLSYNIANHFTPQWAFLPAAALALLIFKARVRSSGRFMRDFYLDKRQHFRARLNSPKSFALGALVLVALFAPVWRETVSGKFVLEPQQRAVIRAAEPGEVIAVMTDEGMQVAAAAPLLTLRNLKLESQADNAHADLNSAEAEARRAQLDYHNIGQARNERSFQREHYRDISGQVAALEVRSPIAGLVVTPSLKDLTGSMVESGAELAEVDNVSTMQARVFIPEFEVPKVSPNAEVSLKLESRFQPIRGQVNSLAPASSFIDQGLVNEEKYKGIAPPAFYVATVLLSNGDGRMMPGMSGDAKIAVGRRSIAGFIFQDVREFSSRKIW